MLQRYSLFKDCNNLRSFHEQIVCYETNTIGIISVNSLNDAPPSINRAQSLRRNVLWITEHGLSYA